MSNRDDELNGDPYLSGFRLPVASLFQTAGLEVPDQGRAAISKTRKSPSGDSRRKNGNRS